MAKEKSKTFAWEQGHALKPEDYEPVPEIRKTGMSQLPVKALVADPGRRVRERQGKSRRQDQAFAKIMTPMTPPGQRVYYDGSSDETSLSEASDLSAARRLLSKDNKLKGLSRFLKKPKKP